MRRPSFMLVAALAGSLVPLACDDELVTRLGDLPLAACVGPGKVEICHATGNPANPYVLIEVSAKGCENGHANHPGDKLPQGDPPSCDEPVDPCDPDPCVNGSCAPDLVDAAAFVCTCDDGWEGVTCELPIAETCPAEYEDESVTVGDWNHYGRFHVGPGETLGVIVRPLTDAPHDPDLYVRAGAEPTLADWDCRPALTHDENDEGIIELCWFSDPGDYFVGVHGSAGSDIQYDLTIVGCSDPHCPDVGCAAEACPFVGKNAAIGADAWQHHGPFELVAGQELAVTVTPTDGDVDLYLTPNVLSDAGPADCVSSTAGLGTEHCSTTTPGTYFVGVREAAGATASYELDVGGCEGGFYTELGASDPNQLDIAVMLIDCLGDGGEQDPADIARYMFEPPGSLEPEFENSIRRFLGEISYGQVDMDGEVFGWYDLCGPSDCFVNWSDVLNHAIAVDPTFDVTQYDGFVFSHYTDTSCAGNGSAHLGPVTIPTNQGEVDAYRINLFSRGSTNFFRRNDGYPVRLGVSNDVAAHEFGHALGHFQHPAGLACGPDALSSNLGDCELEGSYDQFSIMSNFRLELQASHPGAADLERAGWLAPGEITTVASDGVYVLEDLADPVSGQKALRIPLKNPVLVHGGTGFIADYLLVEYRGMNGLDARTSADRDIDQADLSLYTIPNVHGALIRAVDCTTKDACWSFLLDMTPESHDPYRRQGQFADAQLALGEVFTDPYNGIQIETTTLVQGDSLAVSVTFPP